MKIFILEDEIRGHRQPILTILDKHDLTVATDIEMGKRLYAENGPFDLVILDHDMHGYYQHYTEPDTGYAFCLWMTDQQQKIPRVLLHSQNNTARVQMAELLKSCGIKVEEHYYGPNYLNYLRETL